MPNLLTTKIRRREFMGALAGRLGRAEATTRGPRGSLQRAVRAVARGGFWVPRGVLEGFVRSVQRPVPIGEHGDRPTARQTQAAALAAKGLSNKEIACMLGISESTVKFHLSKLFARSGIHDRHRLSVPTEAADAERLARQPDNRIARSG
jgi:DNA-binding NarL/FixJ family response regulator